MDIDIFSNADGFEWDKGNVTKIWSKHRISNSECEEVFFNMPLIVKPDVKHFFLLRAILDDTVDPDIVITVYRTSKISKYRRTT